MAKKRNAKKMIKKKATKKPVKGIKQKKQNRQSKHHPHVEKLIQKVQTIKNHIHKVKNDLQSKVRLTQLEDRIARIKEKYNGKYRREIVGKI